MLINNTHSTTVLDYCPSETLSVALCRSPVEMVNMFALIDDVISRAMALPASISEQNVTELKLISADVCPSTQTVDSVKAQGLFFSLLPNDHGL